jgi:DNA polymerase IV
MRIKKSVEFGASKASEWSSSVTHVIVDSDLAFTDVAKYLKIDRFPVSWQRLISENP